MAVTKEKRQSLVEEFRINPKDVGSAPVQISILTERIETLLEHFKQSPKDYASRQGLLKMVGRRRRLLGYLKRVDKDRYEKILQRLDLRK